MDCDVHAIHANIFAAFFDAYRWCAFARRRVMFHHTIRAMDEERLVRFSGLASAIGSEAVDGRTDGWTSGRQNGLSRTCCRTCTYARVRPARTSSAKERALTCVSSAAPTCEEGKALQACISSDARIFCVTCPRGLMRRLSLLHSSCPWFPSKRLGQHLLSRQ